MNSKEEAKKRIAKLSEEIGRYRHSYHVLNKSLISDEALDSLKKELYDLELKYPDLVKPDSPTQRVAGAPLKEFKKVRHIAPMISLNDAFSEKDMEDWLTRLGNYLKKDVSSIDFFCELKIDGLAIELVYENGHLIQASTRGDGVMGEDVTQNIKTVEAIPLKLESGGGVPVPKRLVVRGEVYLSQKDFERINKEQMELGEKPYANPRNVAAGSVRQLDPKITAARHLDSFAYDIVYSEGPELKAKTHEEKHSILHKLGFKTNPHNARAVSLKEVYKFRDYWEKHREKIDYEIDGVVIIVNDDTLFDEAGVIGKAPRGAVAYKFSSREATTLIKGIKVQVGRTGAITPVAELEPVQLGGITITHSTLHNADEIKRLGLKIGDTVVVSRAGDVIPKIMRVLPELRTGKEKEFHMPKNCPSDGSEIVADGVIYRCSNPDCGARIRESLYHFVSRGAYNMDGVGPKIIDRFLDEGLITDAADLFTLDFGDIAALERFGEKSADNILKEISSKKEIDASRFIYSLGILHVGEETAELLARHIAGKIKTPTPKSKNSGRGSDRSVGVEDIIQILANSSLEDLQEIPDIGPKVAESIHKWFQKKSNIKYMRKLESVGVLVNMPKSYGTKLAGKKFVITGTFSALSRDAAKERIKSLGGSVSDSVSVKTDYVAVGENPGSKADKAKKLGIKILNESELGSILK